MVPVTSNGSQGIKAPAGRRKPSGESVSVIIPTFNRVRLVTRAVDSALASVSTCDEIIVIDDGSTDETESVLASYGNAIRYIKTHNRGAGAARNLGVRTAAHNWIAFLDSDDEWMPDHLDIHRSFMARSDALLSFSNFDIHYDGVTGKNDRRMQLVSWTDDHRDWGEIIAPGAAYTRFADLPAGRSDFNVYIGNLYHIMFRRSYIPAWTSLVRRDVAGGELRFPEDLPTFEDYECYIRLSRRGAAAYLDCVTAINHGHGGPRLTGVEDLTKAAVRMTILKRTYGADSEFFSTNRAVYEQTLRDMNWFRAKEFLKRGLVKEARNELKQIKPAVPFLRLLSQLPGFVIRTLWNALRKVK